MFPVPAFCGTYDIPRVCDYEFVRAALDHHLWEGLVYGFSSIFLVIIFLVMLDAMLRQPRPPLDRALVGFFGIFSVALINRVGIVFEVWDDHLAARVIILGIAVITEAMVLWALHYERKRSRQRIFLVRKRG